MNHDTTKLARRRKPDHAKIQIKGSWTAIPNKLIVDMRLSRDARLLGTLIFMRAGNSGKAFPTQEKMAEELGCTRRSIQRWLEELQAAGWIDWRQTLRNNEYIIKNPDEANDIVSDSSDNEALISVTAVSPHVIPVSHGNATQGSPNVTAVSHSGTTLGSAPTTAVSHPTLLHEDSLYIDSSSSSDSMPPPPDDGDDDLVVIFLREAGVTAAQEFRGLDLAAVQERVAMLQRDPNCRPGAIVKSLRASPPRPKPAMGSPGYIDQLNAKYGDLFRSGSDVSGLLPEDQALHVGAERSPNARPKKPDRA